MYSPAYFKNENIEEVKSFLKANSFGILINQTEGKLWGTHIPLELEVDAAGNDVLQGHISKANPQWKNFNSAEEVMAIFNGPHAYVSSSWYQQENVPTWNYIAVHVYGQIRIIEGEELIDSLRKLVDKYEKHSEHPISVDSMSEKTLRQVKGIVGFEIKISSIEAAYKLSQNRNDADHGEIIRKLSDEAQGNVAKEIGSLMKKDRE